MQERLSIDSRTNGLYGELLRSKAQEQIMEQGQNGAVETLGTFSFVTVRDQTPIEKEEMIQHQFIIAEIL